MRNCSTVRLGDCSLAKNPLTGTDAQKLLHKSERRKFQDELRHLKTRQGRFDAAMLHLDHPLPGTDLCLDPSDCGRSAAGMYDELEVVPLWLRLWRLGATKLPRKGRAALYALTVDWRTTTFASGKRRVYATFESVKTVGGMARQIGGWVTVYPAVSRSRSRSSRGREEGVGVG